MDILELIIEILAGLVVVIPLVIKLIEYVSSIFFKISPVNDGWLEINFSEYLRTNSYSFNMNKRFIILSVE